MGWKPWCAIGLTLLGYAGQASAEPAIDCAAQLPGQLRVLDCEVANAVSDAIGRSSSLQSMVARIGELKGIVYVTAPVDVTRKTTLAGGFFHRIVSVGETRLLWIALAHESRYSDHSMAILGHELRHVLEVLESRETRTEADVDALYGRIGHVTGAGIVETDAAFTMGRQVERELALSRHAAKTNARR
jgi:hypothetical protein